MRKALLCAGQGGALTCSLVIFLAGLLLPQNSSAQCGGLLTLSEDTLIWSCTYVGTLESKEITVVNPGPDNVCIQNVTSSASVWVCSLPPPILGPGEVATILVTFAPTCDRWHYGTVEIITGNEAHPRDSIIVMAQGRKPIITPMPLLLHPGGTSFAQPYSLPWDENSIGTEYAIRMSGDFVGLSNYVNLEGEIESDATWATAETWGVEGSGVILGLSEQTEYQAQLIARDCTGSTAESYPVFFSTPQEIDVAPVEQVTAHYNADSSAVELRWNPVVQDVNGISVAYDGWFVLQGNHSDTIESLAAVTDTNFSQLATASAKKFFEVLPNTNGTYVGTMPIITWPPNGARLYGMNMVSVKDLLNSEEWISASLTIDSMGFLVELLSPEFEAKGSGGFDRMLDFDGYGVGFHTLTASATDKAGMISSQSILVEVVQRPKADFLATYDVAGRVATLSAVNYQTPPGIMSGVWWPILGLDERYGSVMQFTVPEDDTVIVVQAIPQMDMKYLNDEDPWPNPEDAAYGVVINPEVPQQIQVAGTDVELSPCCVSVELDMSPSAGLTRGPYTKCKASGCELVVAAGVRFEIVTNWEWRPGTFNHGYRMNGRGTYVKEIGTVAVGADTVFTATNPTKADTTHVHGANPGNPVHKLPYEDGVNEEVNSNSNIKPNKHKADPANGKPNPYGKTSNNGNARNIGKDGQSIADRDNMHSGCDKKGKPNAVRTKGDVYIEWESYDPCDAGSTCERTWDIHWDVIFWYSDTPAPPDCREKRITGPSIAPED